MEDKAKKHKVITLKRAVQLLIFAIVVFLLFGFSASGRAQTASTEIGQPQSPDVSIRSGTTRKGVGRVLIPQSSQANPEDLGKRAHTHHEVFVPAGWQPDLVEPPYAGYAFETPASLACVYHLVTIGAGCNPNTFSTNPTGGSKAIAIVDAFDDPYAAPDLAYFSAQMGLPFSPSQFTVIYESGSPPMVDSSGGWELEESLDVQWAHAMAPSAHIYLVEADSNFISDLTASVVIATNLVQCGSTTTCASVTGAGEVSMSWGTDEFSGETSYDSVFNAKNVTFFASTGDYPGTEYPSASGNVVAVGGTTIRRNPTTGNYIQEDVWTENGGGVSAYEPLPSYQTGVVGVGTKRSLPDISAVANPDTGVWVYDSFPFEIFQTGGWFIVGGTSVSAPTVAGIVNNAAGRTGGSFAANSAAELAKIYANRSVAADYRDITYGFCGPYAGFLAGTGWDLCSGVGSSLTYAGK